MDNNQYQHIGYTHEELEALLKKINDGRVLKKEDYEVLVNEIKIENISTFSGNYEDLENKPDLNLLIDEYISRLDLPSNENMTNYINLVKIDIVNMLNDEIGKLAQKNHTHRSSDIEDLSLLLNDKANKNHSHDDSYYNKSIIDDKIQQVKNSISNITGYVTEEQVENMLNEKANINHTHDISDIPEFQNALDSKLDISAMDDVYTKAEIDNKFDNIADETHEHDMYYTKEESDEKFAASDDLLEFIVDLEDKLDGKANIDHTHDFDHTHELIEHDHNDLYYTEDEIDNKLNEINDKINDIEVFPEEEVNNALDNKINEVYDNVYKKTETYSKNEVYEKKDVYTKNEVFTKAEVESKLLEFSAGGDIQIDLSGYVNKTELQETINELNNALADKSDKEHKHDNDYASKIHNHEEFALENHVHDGYALDNHNHDEKYSLNNHKHDNDYAPKTHEHDYADKTHEHDYAPTDHNHEGFASDDHNHDGVYAPDGHKHDLQIEDIEGLQEILNNKLNKDELPEVPDDPDTPEVPDNIVELLDNKADINHTHKISEIENLQEELNNIIDVDSIINSPQLQNKLDEKADSDHNHIGIYSPESHNHDNNYASKSHNHDEKYSEKTHNHDGVYAPDGHTHELNIHSIPGLQTELNNKANSNDVYTKNAMDLQLTNFYDKAYIDQLILDLETGGDIQIDLGSYVKRDEFIAGLSGKSDNSHIHTDYITEAAVRENYSEKTHNHNEAYAPKLHGHEGVYSEIGHVHPELAEKAHTHTAAEVSGIEQIVANEMKNIDTMLSNKADSIHTHDISDIKNLQTTLDSKANQTEIKDYVDNTINSSLNGKADSGHIHDDLYSKLGHTHEGLYYTKAEIDEVIEDKNETFHEQIMTEANLFTTNAIAELTAGSPSDMNTFKEVSDALAGMENKINDEAQKLTAALSDKSDSNHVHTEYATLQSEEEREIFRTTELTVSPMGGIAAGTNLDGMTVKEILAKLLYPYMAPTVAVYATPNGGIFEKGNKQTITNIRVVITKKSEKITKLQILQGTTTLVNLTDSSVTDGGTFNYPVTIPVDSVNVQLTAKVTDATGNIVSANSTAFNFVYPYYIGVCGENDTVNEALIKSLNKRIETKANKSISYTTNQQRMIFAYPKAYGNISKIIDPNNFDVTSTFVKQELTITGLDGTAQVYYVYINNSSSVENFTMKFNY